eukprot:GHVU01092939.1.p5 GENE.GHVU01092939.1~~GHVU01092939.1.p5  ORF type:complete len:105 (+),score=18.57 GHVU01092939.1:763-1077(+)
MRKQQVRGVVCASAVYRDNNDAERQHYAAECTKLLDAAKGKLEAAYDVSVEEGQRESDAATGLLGELKALTVMEHYLPKSVMKIRCKMDCGLPITCVDAIRMLA